MSIDYEHELGNGWGPWQQVVLAGMKEIRDDVKEVKETQAEQATDIALIKQTVSAYDGLPVRLQTLEDDKLRREERAATRKKYAGYVGAGVTVVILPVLLTLMQMGIIVL